MEQKYKTPGILAAEIKMTRSSHDGAILIVEGGDDIRFWRPRCRDECELVDGEGKPNVVGCILNLDKENFKGILGIVDSDYDFLTGEKADSKNIVSTDAHDLECILCRSAALDTLLAEYGDFLKIDKFEKKSRQSVRDALLERAMMFGRLRLAALRPSVIHLEKTRVPRFVDKNTWFVKYSELVRESTKYRLPKEIEELKNRIERLKVEEPWYVVRGHDLIDLLRIGLQHVLGHIGPGIGKKELMRVLRAAMTPEALRKTSMWGDIRNWEKLNPQYRILPS